MSDYAADISENDFDEMVIKASYTRLVVADFWAPWCGPCRVLKPILETLAEEFAGRFFLAKINADKNLQLCTTYAVRGIPSVKAFHEGSVVDEFSGTLPEPYVREFLERNIPSRAKQLIGSARDSKARGDVATATAQLEEALSLEPDNQIARVERAAILLDQGNVKDAAALAEGIRGEALDYQPTQVVLARLRFAQESESAPADNVLHEMLSSGGEDAVRARVQLAVRQIASGAYEAGLSELLSILRLRPRDAELRKRILAVFDILGPDDPLVHRYRRSMAALLH